MNIRPEYCECIIATQLAQALGHSKYSVADAHYAHYGHLARTCGEFMDYNPEPECLGTLVLFEKRDGEWHWVMRPELAEGLESLEGDLLIPEEATETEKSIERAVERNVVGRCAYVS